MRKFFNGWIQKDIMLILWFSTGCNIFQFQIAIYRLKNKNNKLRSKVDAIFYIFVLLIMQSQLKYTIWKYLNQLLGNFSFIRL